MSSCAVPTWYKRKSSKSLRPESVKCLSTRGLRVAEAEEGTDRAPDLLEVAKVELEVAVRVRLHVRHPVVAIGFPESLFLIEGGVPLTFR